jgi:hypothetical protein
MTSTPLLPLRLYLSVYASTTKHQSDPLPTSSQFTFHSVCPGAGCLDVLNISQEREAELFEHMRAEKVYAVN